MNPNFLDFSKAKVLILGDVMLDRYWQGDVSRISAEAPVPIVHVQEIQDRPGGAGNVALNVVALGGKVSVFGLCGDDEAGVALRSLLQQHPIDTHLLTVPHMPTVTKLRIVSQHQQLIRLDFENSRMVPEAAQALQQQVQARLASAQVLLLSDYGKGSLTNMPALIAMARQQGLTVLVDPKSTDFSVYHGASLITPNFKEFQAVVGACHTEEAIQEKGQALLRQHQVDALLVTRGERGMTLLRRDQPAHHLLTRAKEVFDVTGAGDTVIATMAAALAAGYSLEDAMLFSNAAAGVVVGKLGAATVSVAELRYALNTVFQRGGVMEESQLVRAIKEARQRGERIVMTNGCFDLLHPGHIAYLEEAKALGDRLIVAVNDDASVRRLNKGPERPINALESRMAVLAGLAAVDWVVPFSEDTPERLVSRLSPDVLVKGGDWAVEQIAGSQHVLQQGGTVKSLPFYEGHSTTSMVERVIAARELLLEKV